ncbi:MAG: LPS-assembly protein LptD [Planctomycetes bacterium]|nr:LPS-assembly protein LptD [Planctomycetota bacterium]
MGSRCATARSRCGASRTRRTRFVLFLFLVITGTASPVVAADLELPLGDPRDALVVSARQARHWKQGLYDVWVLDGVCRMRQGDVRAESERAVIWVDRASRTSSYPIKALVYVEGNVLVQFGTRGDAHRTTDPRAQTLVDASWLGRFHTFDDVTIHAPTVEGEPEIKADWFERGMARRESGRTVAASFVQAEGESRPTFRGSRVRLLPRNGSELQFDTFHNAQANETILVASRGVSVVIEGALVEDVPDIGTLDLGRIELQADNVVAWTSNVAGMNLFGEAPDQPQADASQLPIEFYLEGNIIFRQGRRVIYADRMYYDVKRESGVVLNAEVLTPVQDYEGLVRLKADVLRQRDRAHFAAYGAAITSSRMGHPRYWLQSQELTFEDSQRPVIDPASGLPARDPMTGEMATRDELLATSRNNFVYVASVPVFYWPVMATDLRDPSYYVTGFKIKNDSVFGTQVLVDFDAYQVFGAENRLDGTKWNLSTDLLTERGPAIGTHFTYERETVFGFPTPAQGMLDAWAIKDDGVDRLGRDRRELVPEEDYRGRLLWQHRQRSLNGWQLTAEAGWISDRNFLEQYFQQEWDQFKDQATGVEWKQFLGNQDWSVTADVRVNEFFTQTEWLPRLDHYLIGQSLLGDWFSWHAHSHVGYGHLRPATAPVNPIDAAKFDPLAWEADREGIRTATRHEVSMPLALGPFKIVPYAMGEGAYWGEVLDGDSLGRLFGQAGVRTSVPVWSIRPDVQSELLNVNGIAHKISFESDLYVADASRDLERFPLYDAIDDDATEFFRRRFFFDTFGGVPGGNTPDLFDERYFALRSGVQSWVTGPSAEIADDLAAGRFAVRQRWQTKRGMPGRERIIDWIVFDVEGTVFPNASRDNAGETAGLLNYDFRWHLGDRFTLLSDGFADTFRDGLRTISIGGVASRPGIGQLYVGYRSIEGPITSSILSGTLAYRMSEKWILSAGASFDLGPTGNIGQTVALTRIGESALVRLGLNIDEGRDNVGLVFAIEPRFLPSSRLGNIGGVQLPPAGAMGLE